MPVINSISPLTSSRAGGIPVKIQGTGFYTSNLSSLFSAAPFYSAELSAGGTISSPYSSGVKLSVDPTPDSYAGILLDATLDKVFDISFDITQTSGTLPAVDDAIILAVRASDQADDTTYFDLSIRYKDSIGYYVETQSYISGVEQSTYSRSIGPYNISSLRLIRSGSRISGLVKLDNVWVSINDFNGFADFISEIRVYISNAPTYYSGPFDIILKKFNISHCVSLINQSADISSISDTEIDVITKAAELSSGPIIIGFPDGSILQSIDIFQYTEQETVKRISVNYDIVASVYEAYIVPTRNELFSSAGGFVWDQDEFLAQGRQNNNLYIPSLWDPRTAYVSQDSFQSGHGDHDNIKQIDIIKLKRNSHEAWHARLNHGTYYIRNVPYYLFSQQSITERLGSGLTSDGRSLKNLRYLPKYGIPISVSTLKFDIRSGNIVENKRFNKRDKFTGKSSNGIELDTSLPANIDPAFFEFKVNYNSNNMYNLWKIPVENATAGLYTFKLPKKPLQEYPVVFNRTDIFASQKYVALTYNYADAIYGQFTYGTGPQAPGDYTINYFTGEVVVWLDQDYIDLGVVTFTFDYPAKIEFNNDYIVDHGLSITNPQPSDLSTLVTFGESDGTADQRFRAEEFPIYDLSTSDFFDIYNFNLFLYNPSNLDFDSSWVRVSNLKLYGPSDKVYTMDPDTGLIVFGDGINGKIPNKYHRIVCGYKVTARIEYEPISSVDFWTGRSVDLNLSKNNLNSGFLHLTRREQFPDTITLEFGSGEITALEFTSLRATVYDLEGEPMPGMDVQFHIVADSGQTEDESVISDSDGIAETVFIPDSSIEAMGIFVEAFEEGPDSNTKGDHIEGTYQNNGLIENGRITAPQAIADKPEDIYIFKILDNGDAFTPYDNQTRKGGMFQVYYEYDSGSSSNVLIRPSAINGRVLVFDEPLPQSHDPFGPNYDPAVRGFCIVGKKTVSARATVVYQGVTIQSQTAFLKVGYSPIQKGEWTLPILPTTFDGSEIDRATYITINP